MKQTCALGPYDISGATPALPRIVVGHYTTIHSLIRFVPTHHFSGTRVVCCGCIRVQRTGVLEGGGMMVNNQAASDVTLASWILLVLLRDSICHSGASRGIHSMQRSVLSK